MVLKFKHLFMTSIGLSVFFYIFTFRWERLKKLVYNYFTAVGHPINLAIFRIVFFAFLLINFDFKEVLFFSSFPKELMFPPFGSGWMANTIPINGIWATNAALLFKIFCWMGLLGIFTRFSAIMTAVLFFYTWGIPQMFGKVNHYHNLLWFDLILVFSPCADYFSFDAILKSRRRPFLGIIGPSRAHGLPIRIIWFLIGMAYVGPGFWKSWNDAAGWVMGNSLKHHLYNKWMEFDGWTPIFRLDHYPLLCHMSGVFTLFFELGFIVLIFFPVLRWFAVLGGLAFHTMTNIFMRIPFYNLLVFYLFFLPLDRILHQWGKCLFKDEMTIFYDGNCALCRWTVASLKTLDAFGRIRYFNVLDVESFKESRQAGISQEAALHDMHAVVKTKIYKGYDAYRALVFRIPILWPLLPFMFIWPVTALGRNIYRKVADSRSCKVSEKNIITFDPSKLMPSKAFVITAAILIASGFFCDAIGMENGWPFALYPTFSCTPPLQYYTIQFEITTKNGQRIFLDNAKIIGRFTPERFAGLVTKILKMAPGEKQRKIKALWSVIAQQQPILLSVASVKCYEIIETTVPEEKYRNPLSGKLIYADEYYYNHL